LIMRTSELAYVAVREAPPIGQVSEDSILLNSSFLMQEWFEATCSTQQMRMRASPNIDDNWF